MGTFQEEIRNIPREAVEDIVSEQAFTIWSYYLDAATGSVGILAANLDRVAFYYLRNDGQVVLLEPPGLLKPKDTRFLLDKAARTFRIEFPRLGEFRELVVFDDSTQMGESADEADPELLLEMDRTMARWSDWVSAAFHISKARIWLGDQADKIR